MQGNYEEKKNHNILRIKLKYLEQKVVLQEKKTKKRNNMSRSESYKIMLFGIILCGK